MKNTTMTLIIISDDFWLGRGTVRRRRSKSSRRNTKTCLDINTHARTKRNDFPAGARRRINPPSLRPSCNFFNVRTGAGRLVAAPRWAFLSSSDGLNLTAVVLDDLLLAEPATARGTGDGHIARSPPPRVSSSLPTLPSSDSKFRPGSSSGSRFRLGERPRAGLGVVGIAASSCRTCAPATLEIPVILAVRSTASCSLIFCLIVLRNPS